MLRSLVVYIAVQIVAYCIDLGSFVLLYEQVRLNSILANSIGKIHACLFAFFMHRLITFSSRGSVGQEAIRYSIFALFNTAAASALLLALEAILASVRVAKILSDVILVFLSFTISKTIIFQRKL